MSEYPAASLPEIAFFGRSNVGKSSLINKLAGRRITRVSRTPGRTQRAHFFELNGAVVFVDLPGYGYAKAPARVRKELAEIIESYLTARRPLELAALIVDTRHDPTRQDLQMHERLVARGLRVQIVTTKVDKLSRQQRDVSLSRSRRLMGCEHIIPFSSETGEGKRGLWQAIENQIAAGKHRRETSPMGEARS